MQSITSETLLPLQSDLPALEALYRERPDAFRAALADGLRERPESAVFQVWAARLDLAPPALPPSATWEWAEPLTSQRARQLLGWAVVLVLIAGTWAKWPELMGWSDNAAGDPDFDHDRPGRFYSRFVPFLVVGPLVALFAARYRASWRRIAGIGVIVVALLVIQAVRPIHSDVGLLSAMHVPLLLLSLAGVAAMGRRWRETDTRIGYLQLVSESVAFAGLFVLGGMVLTALSFALFEAIGVRVDRVFEYVAVYGALGVLPVGALVASQRTQGRVAPLVARVFGPMALVVLSIYLPMLIASGGLADRDSLLALNVALIAVLALVILMQAERPDVPRHWTDLVAFGLVAVALVADVAALASIVGRLANGLTPNRLAVVGLNVLVAVHLAGLVVPMGRRALGRRQWPGDGWTARFLNVYAVWGAVVVLAFPFLF